MTVAEYMKLPYSRIIQPIADESGSYFAASVLEFEGCISVGNTFEEAYRNLNEAMELWLEVALQGGKQIPECISSEDYSGRFVIRIPKSLHKKLAIEASIEGVSLNQYALYKLSL
ncbi:MAG: toxin-antitoxin system HicB family antitoxin [Firmicutes bacterium]|nr:toxin-antitoxin system HicB family antitoxin [Bacillota bacterium]